MVDHAVSCSETEWNQSPWNYCSLIQLGIKLLTIPLMEPGIWTTTTVYDMSFLINFVGCFVFNTRLMSMRETTLNDIPSEHTLSILFPQTMAAEGLKHWMVCGTGHVDADDTVLCMCSNSSLFPTCTDIPSGLSLSWPVYSTFQGCNDRAECSSQPGSSDWYPDTSQARSTGHYVPLWVLMDSGLDYSMTVSDVSIRYPSLSMVEGGQAA